MPSRFSFDGAIMFAFRAAHARTFLWVFPLAFAGVFTVFSLLIVYFAQGDLMQVARSFEALDESSVDPDDFGAMMALIFGAMQPLLGWAVLAALGSWVFWAMFEAASQRRYVRDDRFYLAFGSDELRIMAVGLCWAAMQVVFFILPLLMIFGGVSAALELATNGATEAQVARSIVGPVLGGFGVWLVLFVVYIFFATRLAPCFGLTIKDRAFRFLDAWNVSRGRFWPILGAYVIIAIIGGIAVSIAEQGLQYPLIWALTPVFEDVQTGQDIVRAMLSGGALAALAVYMVVRLFLSGLLMHVAGGPAAFAARHDPRGSVDDEYRLDAFN